METTESIDRTNWVRNHTRPEDTIGWLGDDVHVSVGQQQTLADRWNRVDAEIRDAAESETLYLEESQRRWERWINSAAENCQDIREREEAIRR